VDEGVSRRKVLRKSVLAAGAVAFPVGFEQVSPAARPGGETSDTVPFHGRHQAGLQTVQQSHALFVVFDTTVERRTELAALLSAWSEAAAALTRGGAAPPRPGTDSARRSDSGIARGLTPSRLTITFGFGPALFDERYGLAARRPGKLRALPPFPGDALVPAHSDGDVLMQMCADDPQVLSHAFLTMRAIAVGGAQLRWSQSGFLSRPSRPGPPRNLLGFQDQIVNPIVGTPRYDRSVWDRDAIGPDIWMRDGTYLVFRKIRLLLPTWAQTSAHDQDASVGRRLEDGSPLSARAGAPVNTPVDFEARDAHGAPLVGERAHVRQMRPFSMVRRSYNYDYGFDSTHLQPEPADEHPVRGGQTAGVPAAGLDGEHDPIHPGHDAYDAGLLFIALSADPHGQFVPAQRRLSTSDELGRFMQPTGSGIYAIPGGMRRGRPLAAALFS
jgi:deferrochelatase/peroxidase EfeB